MGDVNGGQIQFNNSQRVFVKESSGNSIFMRTDNSKSTTTNNLGNDLRPKFRIGFDAPQINHRQILLTLDENTTDAVDWGYDAEMPEVFDDDMYWVINDKKYVIQATNEFGFDKEIPFNINGNFNDDACYQFYHSLDNGRVKIKEGYNNIDNKLIVIVRDPREVLIRHCGKRLKYEGWDGYDEYFNIINRFKEFKGRKIF